MPRTYRLEPRSVFSSEFTAAPAEGDAPAFSPSIDAFAEEGTMVDDAGRSLSIAKHGLGSGHWSLQIDGMTLAQAHKLDAFSRSFSLDPAGGGGSFALRAEHPLARSFLMLRGDTQIGSIAPDGPFTRRATLEFADDVDPRIALFCFWLAALMWRRTARE
jgi:hypothetical protein